MANTIHSITYRDPARIGLIQCCLANATATTIICISRRLRYYGLVYLYVTGAIVVLRGQKATKQLLEGADLVFSHGRIRKKYFVKNGNINDAHSDFMAVKPIGIRSLRQPDGVSI